MRQENPGAKSRSLNKHFGAHGNHGLLTGPNWGKSTGPAKRTLYFSCTLKLVSNVVTMAGPTCETE